HQRGQPTHFFSYYTDPAPAATGWPLRDALQESRSAFVFGPPGSGKTTLRYTLEADCRAQSRRTLVVTYELSHHIPGVLTADEHWRHLAEELAVDLFIQVIEQFNALSVPPTEAQRHAWRDQMARAWPRLQRVARLVLDETDLKGGLESFWRMLGRPAINYIEPSTQLRDLLRGCLPPDNAEITRPETGEEAFLTGLHAARLWGFRQVFVLVDGVDASRRDTEHMVALIEPLLKALAVWQAQGVFFKFFLPFELQETIVNRLGAPLERLPFSPFETIMTWSEDALRQLLAQRFRSAGSYRTGFDELADARLARQLDDALVQAASGSPRRLLQVVNGLIDAHAGRDPHQLQIEQKDWNQMRQHWRYDPPAPPLLIESVRHL
ncbi:MAG: ATP-binding protein, partial [Chloroflexota bacterium]